MRIAVVGAGAVGGYYGTHLALVREEDIKSAIGDKQALASCIYVTHNQRRLCAWLVPLSHNPKRLLGFSQFHALMTGLSAYREVMSFLGTTGCAAAPSRQRLRPRDHGQGGLGLEHSLCPGRNPWAMQGTTFWLPNKVYVAWGNCARYGVAPNVVQSGSLE
jgi:hypothetical protein